MESAMVSRRKSCVVMVVNGIRYKSVVQEQSVQLVCA